MHQFQMEMDDFSAVWFKNCQEFCDIGLNLLMLDRLHFLVGWLKDNHSGIRSRQRAHVKMLRLAFQSLIPVQAILKCRN